MSKLISEISKLSVPKRIQLVEEILATISADLAAKESSQLTDSQIKEIENRSSSTKNDSAK